MGNTIFTSKKSSREEAFKMKVQELSKKYREEIDPLDKKAHWMFQKWTKTSCRILETYRKTAMTFWHDVAIVHPHFLPEMYYPGKWEKRTLCSFHWALYMVNNRCAEKEGTEGGEPKTFGVVLKTLDTQSQEDMKKFQDVLWKEFPVIQQEAMNLK